LAFLITKILQLIPAYAGNTPACFSVLGESPVYVKEQVGRSSIQITVDIYGKLIQRKKEAGVDRLDNATKCNLCATSLQKTHLTS